MANMFDRNDPDNQGDVTPPGNSPYGNQRYGGQTHGGATYGGRTFGGRKFGRDAPQADAPPEPPPEPPAAIDTNRTYGGNKFGGREFGGNKFGGREFGGNKFGGSRTGIPEREPEPTSDISGDQGGDTRSWGERHSLGARPGGYRTEGERYGGYRTDRPRAGTVEGTPVVPNAPSTPGQSPYGNNRFGGNTFGGNTFGGNTFGGGTFGRSAGEQGADDPMRGAPPGPMDQPQPPDPGDPSNPGNQIINRSPDRMEGPDTIEPQRQLGETGGTPDVGKPTPYPTVTPKAGSRPGGGGAGGGKGGGGGGKGGRLPLGNQSRTEAYDPALDRADPRNIAPIDEQGRVNPRQWERAQKGAIDPTKPGERTGEAAARYTNHYTNALAGAAAYMTDMFHQKKGDPNQGEGYVALTFKSTGAPDPKVVDQVFKVVDPNNELQPKERMELATRAMHDWYVSRGDTQSANKVAAEILQHGNVQAKAYGTQALQALKQGNRPAAEKAILQAYDWLPDGFHADMANGKLTISNDKGQVVNAIPLDDKMIANLGTGLATGTLYWDIVQDRAGVKEKFGPPPPQPTQAIAATAPAGPAAGPPPSVSASATPPSPAPAPGSPPASPGAAPTRGPPTAVAPPAQPPAPVPVPPSQPPPVTPPGNRPVAPAPAAPGPAPTQQASAPPAVPGPGKPAPVAAGTGIKPPEMVVTPQPPPGLTPTPAPAPAPAPAAPPSTPAQGSGGPPGSPAGQPTGQPAGQPQAKPNEPVWDANDPDTVPKVNNKPALVRRETYPVSDEVRAAKQEIARADAKYKADQDWLAYKQKSGKSTTEYQRDINQLKDDIEKTHKNSVARADSIVREHTAAERAHDAQERASLKPRHLEGTALERAETIAKAHFAKIVEQKGDLYKNSALRLYETEDKQTPLIDAVSKIQAINPNVGTKKIAEMVVTAVTHVGSTKDAKKDSMNDHVGQKGSRFLVVGEDLARNPVIILGHGDSRIQLHVPKDTLNDLKKLKSESYNDVVDKLNAEKNKPKTDYGALVPPLSPTGRAIVDTVGGEGRKIQKTLKEGAKITKEKLTEGRDWLRQKYKEKGLE